MIIPLISIFIIAGMAYGAKRLFALPLCPICVGVFLTWLWMLGLSFAGYDINLIIPAILMGGSVVGIANEIGKRIRQTSDLVAFKMLFIPAGFVVVYGIVERVWIEAAVASAVAILIIVTYVRKKVVSPPLEKEAHIVAIEKDMKNCC